MERIQLKSSRTKRKSKSKTKLSFLNSTLIFFFMCFSFKVNASTGVSDIKENLLSSTVGVGVFELGSFIKLKQDLNLRKSPGGEKTAILLKGDEAQVVSIKLNKTGNRYYQVYTKGMIGYVYAGDNQSYDQWVEQAWRSKEKKFLARSGDVVRIKNKNGISIRIKPGDKRVSLIPEGSTVTVRGLKQGEDGKIYYKIKHRSYSGYIYAGNLEKRASLSFWTEVL